MSKLTSSGVRPFWPTKLQEVIEESNDLHVEDANENDLERFRDKMSAIRTKKTSAF
jgi:hypothetical protein